MLRVKRAGNRVLIGGDAPLGAWKRLEREYRPARVIRVPHHGGALGRSEEDCRDFYREIGAELAVFSVGTNNRFGHPLPAHVRAARRGGACRVACTQLTERCHDEPLRLREDALELASGVEWPYRHRASPGAGRRPRSPEVPCAGTVLVALHADGSMEVLPGPSEHGELLRRLDHPLCAVSAPSA